MKLKLNREEYLWVDLSTKYKDILDEGIPFHMWDEWIIKKLKQLVKNIWFFYLFLGKKVWFL